MKMMRILSDGSLGFRGLGLGIGRERAGVTLVEGFLREGYKVVSVNS